MKTNGEIFDSSAESSSSAGNSTAFQPAPVSSPSSPVVSRAAASSEPLLRFSKQLQEFYKGHNFLPSGNEIPCSCPYRYIRLNPRFDKEQTLSMIRNEVRNKSGINSSEDTGEKDDNAFIKSTAVLKVPWLENRWAFYALPSDFSLSTSQCFRSGRIYGMDVSSGAGVAVLLTDNYDKISVQNESTITEKINAVKSGKEKDAEEVRILDLCCSPGLKLLQMVDFFHREGSLDSITGVHKQNPVKVVGVDVCKHRMDVCKSILQKYLIDSDTSGRACKESSSRDLTVQLYLEDGTAFGVNQPSEVPDSDIPFSSKSDNLIFDSRVAIEEMLQRGGKRKRMNKSARAREKKKLRQIAFLESGLATNQADQAQDGLKDCNYNKEDQTVVRPFDYVLVDAECSTDGSFKHIKERIKESFCDKATIESRHREENKRLTDASKLAELVVLQRKLLASGFRLLKDGGTLVYSTCSLSEDQNERVVEWLLTSNQNAVLVPIHFPSIMQSDFVTEGSLSGTVRFYPNVFQDAKSPKQLLGDGFFVAKLRKRPK